MYATVMDEISEEINKNEQHITLQVRIPTIHGRCISNSAAQEMHTMLDITNEISSRYRIVFGKEKSKVMKIGSSVQTELKLWDMGIEETDQYK